MIYLYIACFVAYTAIGILKLKFFDRNGEGGWLFMMTDERSMRISTSWVYLFLLILWWTWPLGLIFKNFSIAERIFKFQWDRK